MKPFNSIPQKDRIKSAAKRPQHTLNVHSWDDRVHRLRDTAQ